MRKTCFCISVNHGILKSTFMDNFKRHSNWSKKPSIVDGFVSKSPPRPRLNPEKPHKPAKKEAVISDFKRPEGFIPRNRTNTSGSVPDGTGVGRKPIYKKELDMSLDTNNRAKRGKVGKHRNWKKIIKRTVLILLAVIIAGGTAFFALAYWRARQVFKGGAPSALAFDCNVDPSKLNAEGDGRVNILMLGKGGPGHDGEDLTDTLLVASIDPCQKDAALVSVPRDLYVKVPGNGSMKINTVYPTYKQNALAEGKSEEEAESIAIDATERTMEEVLGIPIHYYVMVDFEAFRRAIDTVGGVTVDVKEPLYDYNVAWENDWDPLIAPAGVQQFDGKKALLYARSRYGSARGDFDRAERQRQILVALRDKIFSLGTFGNPLKISQLMDAFGDHVSTNLSIDDVMSLYELAKEVEGHEVTSIGLADPPNDYVVTDNIGGLSVVVPKEGLYQYGAIHTYIRNALKDGFVRKENPSIIVLNGTTESGRASEFADTLKGYGYNVVEVSDAPSTDYEETVFVNLRGKDKAYTQRYIEQHLGVKATGKLPSGVENPNNADFIIILGPGS